MKLRINIIHFYITIFGSFLKVFIIINFFNCNKKVFAIHSVNLIKDFDKSLQRVIPNLSA